MTQMKRQKLCVRATQRRIEELLMKVHLETMEKPLYKTCVTFTQSKVV